MAQTLIHTPGKFALNTKIPGRLRWGILATGNIADRFAEDALHQGLNVIAVASRDSDKARTFAAKHRIPKSYGDYASLLKDPEVDVVYISLPNQLHAEWTVATARAGKHILCEKPFLPTLGEAQKVLAEVAKAGVFFMEAFMYRCHPQWIRVKELLNQGVIGELRMLEARHSYDMGEAWDNIRLRRETWGGSLMDVGCYCVSFFRDITGLEPIHAEARSQIGSRSGVDEWTGGVLTFANGVIGTFSCASRCAQPQFAGLYGSQGRIEIPMPWHPAGEGGHIKVYTREGERIITEADGLRLFAREALMVEAAILAGATQSRIMTWDDTLGQASALAALRRSAGHSRDGD